MMWHTIEVVFISVWGDPTYHVVNVLTAVARHRLCRQMPLRRAQYCRQSDVVDVTTTRLNGTVRTASAATW